MIVSEGLYADEKDDVGNLCSTIGGILFGNGIWFIVNIKKKSLVAATTASKTPIAITRPRHRIPRQQASDSYLRSVVKEVLKGIFVVILLRRDLRFAPIPVLARLGHFDERLHQQPALPCFP